MTKREANDYACKKAGLDKTGWNSRYIDALREVGYRLQSIEYQDQRAEDSFDAPLPYENGQGIKIGISQMCSGGWHYPSVIVPL